MRVGSAKRLRSAKYLPFSSSRVGRRPVGNSLDHLVSGYLQRERTSKAERFCGLEIDDEFELGWLHDGQVRRLRPVEDSPDIYAGLSTRVL